MYLHERQQLTEPPFMGGGTEEAAEFSREEKDQHH